MIKSNLTHKILPILYKKYDSVYSPTFTSEKHSFSGILFGHLVVGLTFAK
ncbi:hypothetical protein EXN66_Car012977 [Channa argus]|uniref:Uncharacterized protein n=1 Tax=Channa argus TaxID=215402 RepID=A0A6G1Q463_CHAAH|nr:hypothetical protein EXN66_Car012977 [Channa argus]